MNRFVKNVFINCPFDNGYFPILKAIFFTLIYLDFIPKISETTDSGASRLVNIKNLIKVSKYSIHDISRVELNDRGLPRFNMPLECGIDFGFKLSDDPKLKEKVFLILEKEPYRYQEFMSDIAGNDIRSHKNSPQIAIKHIRDWIKLNTSEKVIFQSEIWLAYIEFLSDYEKYSKQNKYDPNDIGSITFSDLIELIQEWVIGWRERKTE